MPCLSKPDLISGSERIERSSESSLETTGVGVPLGAMNAYHMSTSAPFTPNSCKVETSGAFG